MTLKELYLFGKQQLKLAEVEEEHALILSEEILGADRREIAVNGTREVEKPLEEQYKKAISLRKNNYPLQYILGYEYFCGLKFFVKDGVLIPREDTMVLVECGERFIGDKALSGLDLCAGTGAVAIGLSSLCKNAKITAVELFPVPLECLERNIASLSSGNVTLKKGDVLSEKTMEELEQVDFILSNPPYIEKKEIETLQIEVQKEPHTALDGGEDGLVFYKFIVEKWSKLLKKGGLLAFEIGETQGEDVRNLMNANNYANINVIKDLNGLDRVVFGCKI